MKVPALFLVLALEALRSRYTLTPFSKQNCLSHAERTCLLFPPRFNASVALSGKSLTTFRLKLFRNGSFRTFSFPLHLDPVPRFRFAGEVALLPIRFADLLISGTCLPQMFDLLLVSLFGLPTAVRRQPPYKFSSLPGLILTFFYFEPSPFSGLINLQKGSPLLSRSLLSSFFFSLSLPLSVAQPCPYALPLVSSPRVSPLGRCPRVLWRLNSRKFQVFLLCLGHVVDYLSDVLVSISSPSEQIRRNGAFFPLPLKPSVP